MNDATGNQEEQRTGLPGRKVGRALPGKRVGSGADENTPQQAAASPTGSSSPLRKKSATPRQGALPEDSTAPDGISFAARAEGKRWGAGDYALTPSSRKRTSPRGQGAVLPSVEGEKVASSAGEGESVAPQGEGVPSLPSVPSSKRRAVLPSVGGEGKTAAGKAERGGAVLPSAGQDKGRGASAVLPSVGGEGRGASAVLPSVGGEGRGAAGTAAGRDGVALPVVGRKASSRVWGGGSTPEAGEMEEAAYEEAWSQEFGEQEGEDSAASVGEGESGVRLTKSGKVDGRSSASRRPKSEFSPRKEALVVAGDDWSDEDDDEEAQERKEELAAEASALGVRVVPRDINIIRFLARYRYAQDVQVARFVGTSDKSAYIRLAKLAKARLVRRKEITRGQTLWQPTSSGLAIADCDLPDPRGKISITGIGHELGLANIGVELEIGGDNVLYEPVWPLLNRFPESDALADPFSDEMLPGETVFTTREIRRGHGPLAKNGKPREERIQERDELLEAWTPGERSPETLPHNSGMFVLYSANYGDHVPDMVVARQRADDGSPRSIAIELELSPKPVTEWRRILLNFRESEMIGKLVYFTTRKSIADALLKLNENEIGMSKEQFKVLRYTPRKAGLPFWG